MPETSQFAPLSLTADLPLGNVLLIIFLSVLAVYIVYAVILHYHWRQYSSSRVASFWTFVAFAAGSIPLLALSGLIALTY